MTTSSHINASVRDRDGGVHGPYHFIDDDPQFFCYPDAGESLDDIDVHRGYSLLLATTSGEIQERHIVGVTVDGMGYLRIIAPRTIMKANPDAEYLRWKVSSDMEVEMRAGTTFIGGTNSGFPDGEGIVLQAEHIGGDPAKCEDWAFYVIGKSNYRQYAPQWILLDDIRFATSGPTEVVTFAMPPSKTIDDLLADGEASILEYFAVNPAKLEEITPRQFEDLVKAIYNNLGFDTESIGAWNQADGGVDLIAVHKSLAGMDYRLAVQCKASKNKISARPLRELAGVLDGFRAHQGVVATTSRFTSSARQESDSHLWRVSLQDRDALIRRIISIVRPEFKPFIDRI